MNDNKGLILLSRNHEYYKILTKLAELITTRKDREVVINDFKDSIIFSIEERNVLTELFNGSYESITTKDFTFHRKNDRWYFDRHDYPHTYSIKILFRMNNETEYGYNSIVNGSDLNLVSTLIKQFNRILEVDLLEEIGEAVEGYEINQDMIDFVSMYLMNNAGDLPQMDYAFIRVFLNAIQEYDDLLFDNLEEL
jgi:hypothetical protein